MRVRLIYTRYVGPALLLFTTASPVFAQQYIGTAQKSTDLSRAIYQPALIADDGSSLKANLFSLSASIDNNAYSFNKQYLLSKNTAVFSNSGNEYYKNTSNRSKEGLYSLDAVGPSASLNLDGKHFLAFSTRFRQIASFSGLNNNIFQMYNKLDDRFYNHTFHQDNLKVNIYSFAEMGFSYAQHIWQNEKNKISAGVTLNYIIGTAAANMYVTNMNLNIAGIDYINQMNGDFSVANSDNVKNFGNAVTNAYTISGRGSMGIDLGLSYEYNPSGKANNYRVRIAAAITDIGKVQYTASLRSHNYHFNADNTTITDIQKKTGETNADYFSRMQSEGYITHAVPVSSFSEQLPTALRTDIDVHISKGFYTNTSMLINLLPDSKTKYGSGYLTTFVVTPRFETKRFAIGMPLSYNQLGSFNTGFYVSAGPVFLGSQSIINNIASSSINRVDAYAGIKWTVTKKHSRNS